MWIKAPDNKYINMAHVRVVWDYESGIDFVFTNGEEESYRYEEVAPMRTAIAKYMAQQENVIIA